MKTSDLEIVKVGLGSGHARITGARVGIPYPQHSEYRFPEEVDVSPDMVLAVIAELESDVERLRSLLRDVVVGEGFSMSLDTIVPPHIWRAREALGDDE